MPGNALTSHLGHFCPALLWKALGPSDPFRSSDLYQEIPRTIGQAEEAPKFQEGSGFWELPFPPGAPIGPSSS